VRFALGAEAHVYDVRAGKYLGKTAAVETTLAPGDTALYACLPYQVKELAVSAPAQAKPGDTLSLKADVHSDGGRAGDHVLHIELLTPQGRPAWHYTWNVLARGGTLNVDVPLALNEAPGQWSVRVRDVLTGVAAETTFTVLER